MTPAASSSAPVVLLVEDDVQLRATMKLALEAEFQVDTAASAEEAELCLGTRPYAAIISDHMMAGEQGLSLLVRNAGLRPAVARILMTGYTNPELLSRSVAVAKLSACLIKPVPAADLLAAVRRAVRGGA